MTRIASTRVGLCGQLGDRLGVPSGIKGILWDMDGVLLDSLSMDFNLTCELLRSHLGYEGRVDREVIRQAFPYDLCEYWRRVVAAVGFDIPRQVELNLVSDHEEARRTISIAINEGVVEVLTAAHEVGLIMAVVSNNPVREVEAVLHQAGLAHHFSAVTGNDTHGGRNKPSPDPYLHGAESLGLAPSEVVAVEDSLLGLSSARRAGCFTVGVATGAARYTQLDSTADADHAYHALRRIEIVCDQHLDKLEVATPSPAIDRLLAAFFKRQGIVTTVRWHSNDWPSLGFELAKRLEGHGDGLGRQRMVDSLWAAAATGEGGALTDMDNDRVRGLMDGVSWAIRGRPLMGNDRAGATGKYRSGFSSMAPVAKDE